MLLTSIVPWTWRPWSACLSPFAPRKSEKILAVSAVIGTVETTDAKATGTNEASETTDETEADAKAVANSGGSETIAAVGNNKVPTTGLVPPATT